MLLRESDEIIDYEPIFNWYKVRCNKCQDVFFVKADKERKAYCRCDKLIAESNNKNSIIYILENSQNLIKVGMSTQGKTFDSRIKSFNRHSKPFDYTSFNVIYTLEIESRAVAYSIERFIHMEMKNHKIKETPPFSFVGEGEIYHSSNTDLIKKLIKFSLGFLQI